MLCTPNPYSGLVVNLISDDDETWLNAHVDYSKPYIFLFNVPISKPDNRAIGSRLPFCTNT